MSTAHRPTWNPAQGKEVKSGSRQFSARDVASQTKLKFRQPGQTSEADVQKRDLRAELLKAEQGARERKRKAAGGTFVGLDASVAEIEDRNSEEIKRRKLLQDALELDKDDDDEVEVKEENRTAKAESNDDDDGDGDDEEDEGEDETAELLRELEKIKKERAEEQARKEREAQEQNVAAREEEIATANPLLNLQAALGQGAEGPSGGSFAVKKRWDDDLIFKNQAVNNDKPSGQFVNDLLRTEFHRKFMAKFIK